MVSGGSSADDVDVDAQHVADRGGVLGAIQPLERPMAGIRIERGGCGRCRVSSDGASAASVASSGPLGAGRRHHAGAELADHLLGDVGVIVSGARIERRERQSARLAAVAVTADAVPA